MVIVMRSVAVMPIKLNNERLPGKNTMMLGERPLLNHMLLKMRKAKVADEIYVYCSSAEIRGVLPEGILFLERAKFLDQPLANFNQIFSEFMKTVDADIYIYIHATAPFVSLQTIIDCYTAVTDKGYDSAFCAEKIQDFLWEDGEPMNFDGDNLPRSQDLKPIYRETSGVYVFRREVFERLHRRIGKHPYIKEVGYKEAVDINTLHDFKLAEALLEADI